MEASFGVELRAPGATHRRASARERRALDRGRCFGGGSSSSSSSSQTTYNTDRRVVAGEGAVGVSSDSSTITVNMLDGNAIEKSFDFAKLTASGLQNIGNELFKSLDRDRAFVEEAGKVVAKAYDDARGEGTEKFLVAVGVLATVGIVTAVAFSGRGK